MMIRHFFAMLPVISSSCFHADYALLPYITLADFTALLILRFDYVFLMPLRRRSHTHANGIRTSTPAAQHAAIFAFAFLLSLF